MSQSRAQKKKRENLLERFLVNGPFPNCFHCDPKMEEYIFVVFASAAEREKYLPEVWYPVVAKVAATVAPELNLFVRPVTPSQTGAEEHPQVCAKAALKTGAFLEITE